MVTEHQLPCSRAFIFVSFRSIYIEKRIKTENAHKLQGNPPRSCAYFDKRQ